MTKYVVWTDHRAKFNDEDRVMPLEAQNLLDAMKEAGDLCKDDANLYCACLYRKIAKDKYKQIRRSDDGVSFYKTEASVYLTRSTFRFNGKVIELFEHNSRLED